METIATPTTSNAGTPAAGDSVDEKMLCADLVDVLKRFKNSMAQLAEAYGLTSIQLYALHAIMQGSQTMGKVAQTLHCDASNVTGIVDRLVALNLITRQESPQDRRVKTLELTDEGSRLITTVNDELPARLGCSALQASERSQLHTLLQKLAA